jgi:D-arabinose 1-dehydrogenase-like Zn-dependent alcohol dehydrogenase
MENQVAYLIEPKKLEIRASDLSEPGKDNVLVEVKHVGVCGADIHGIRARFKNMSPIPPLYALNFPRV